MKEYLMDKQPEWKILEAVDCQKALEMCQENNIDVFTVDLNMPGMDGFELIEKLRPEYSHAKMAILTANIQDSTHKRSEDLGVTCVHKPVTEQSIDQILECLA